MLCYAMCVTHSMAFSARIGILCARPAPAARDRPWRSHPCDGRDAPVRRADAVGAAARTSIAAAVASRAGARRRAAAPRDGSAVDERGRQRATSAQHVLAAPPNRRARRLLVRLLERAAFARFARYGVTEATVYQTLGRVSTGDVPTVSVGRPLPGVTVALRRACPDADAGADAGAGADAADWGTALEVHSTALCYAMLCYAMLCYAMLCYAMLCYAMLCYAMLCYAML
jgi:hypothetical protein